MRRAKGLLLLLAIGVLATATYAFAAASTSVETGAGAGSGTISGYTISSVVWTLDSDSPGEIDSVSFGVSPSAGAGAATQVFATVDNGTTWITCTGGPTWTCTFGAGVLASGVTTLRISSVQ